MIPTPGQDLIDAQTPFDVSANGSYLTLYRECVERGLHCPVVEYSTTALREWDYAIATAGRVMPPSGAVWTVHRYGVACAT